LWSSLDHQSIRLSWTLLKRDAVNLLPLNAARF
jgi:hypothetical protein